MSVDSIWLKLEAGVEVSHSISDTIVWNSRWVVWETVTNNQFLKLPESIRPVVQALREQFEKFDEYWIFGHKWDIVNNLIALGIIPQVDVMHVNRSLWTKAKKVYDLPPEAWASYEWLLTWVNQGFHTEIERISQEHKRVFIAMPFPNKWLEDLVEKYWVADLVTFWCPVTAEHFFSIEDKIWFSELADSAWLECTIPWAILKDDVSYADICKALWVNEWWKLVLQKKLSWWWDGTVFIESSEQLEQIKINRADSLEKWNIKVSKFICFDTWEEAYPMNGTACILPWKDGQPLIYFDHPSHKPVWLESLWWKPWSGNGNDWTSPLPESIIQQYFNWSKQLCQKLYEQYGYCWLAWPDGLRTDSYYMNELNPRFQWTTPFQTLNALMNDRIPIELLHYVALFAKDKPELLDLLPHPDVYNKSVRNEKGGYYVKLGVKDEFQISKDVSGPWIFTDQGQLEPVGPLLKPLLTPEMTYMWKSEYPLLDTFLKKHNVIRVKCPEEWTTVTPWPSPFGFILWSGMQVFDSQKPKANEKCVQLYDAIISLIKQS